MERPASPIGAEHRRHLQRAGERQPERWFTISCATSGAHTATVSGGPTTFTFDPDADFTAGESCTVTIVAANVTDQDVTDPPDSHGR